ncbi:AVAST type 2 anti-phage system protein Avs2 [Chryseobacterium indologenes]|uniref:AVAST type 2 anti-phage system protein Avs2 n=1 Tax=Chryseobacterium indologenes TaxID=253 RepID=UPI004058DF41
MYTIDNDNIVTELTVHIIDSKTENSVGTGILINQNNSDNTLYLVSAAHCFFEDGDSFQTIRTNFIAKIFNPTTQKYVEVNLVPDENLLFRDIDKDIGLIVLSKSLFDFEISTLNLIKERETYSDFIIKGFPLATQGKEIVTINPVWNQAAPTKQIFNLQLSEDYSSYNITGFSGSGVFLKTPQEVYLMGIFTRYRSEEKGKIIYCQNIDVIDELLQKNYRLPLTYSYIGSNGLTSSFFKNHVEKAIGNLGERYSDKLNFRLPIAHRFNELSKDNLFKKRLLKILDEWLTDRAIGSTTKLKKISVVEERLDKLRMDLVNWEKSNPFNVLHKIDLNWFLDELRVFDKLLDNTISELINEAYQLSKENTEKKNDAHRIFGTEIGRLREISKANYKLLGNLTSKLNFDIANNPFMIIKGEAGAGKSHLLGDIAQERSAKNLPTILLLGQLFNSSLTIERNIVDQLDLSCNFNELLCSLDGIGRQINSRVLILIDAVNETAGGITFWKDRILGLIDSVSKFPYIGIAFTIRDTYWDYMMPKNIKVKATVVEHEGFRGNEYEALKTFCKSYGLEQPSFPILSHEFSNPLFLKLCCAGIVNSGSTVFPSGFNGINNVFNYYIDSVYHKISSKAEYRLRPKIVWQAIKVFSKACSNKNRRQIKLNEVLQLFKSNFADTPNLLMDLIEEGIFIKSLPGYYHDENGKYVKDDSEQLYFAYERLGDFLIADYKLQAFKDSDDVIRAFAENGKFDKYINNFHYNERGLLEAFAVILPERFSLELYEVYNWVFQKYFILNEKKENVLISEDWEINCSDINDAFLKSLKWRKITSIDDDKITEYLDSKEFNLTVVYSHYLYIIFQLSCIPLHPMNGDRLHKILLSYTMPDRDSFWQHFIIEYSDANFGDGDLPVKRLLDFAWQSGISSQLNDETCRLLGQTLAWILATTDTILRDKVTKALVNLFEEKPFVLMEILKSFQKVNDLYILERLYAVTYGVVLRTNSDEGVQKFAQHAFDQVFKSGRVPTHILLRDYARNIIEYAVYKGLKLKCKLELIRPPYKSKIPKLPTDEEIEKYQIHYKSSKFEKSPKLSRLFSKPYYSTMDDDFGRKEIAGFIDDFYPISYTKEPDYKIFIRKANKMQKTVLKVYSNIINHIVKLETNDYQLKLQLGEKKYKEQLERAKKQPKKLLDKSEELSVFQKSDLEFLKNDIVPYLEVKERLKSIWGYTNTLDSRPFRRWIVERVHKLGYTIKKHGQFDLYYSKFDGSDYRYHIDRIGKKYQKIAMYEIFAIIADNFKINTGSRKFDYFQGAWQNYLRDIDPAFILLEKDSEVEENIEEIESVKMWYDDKPYLYWNIPSPEWSVSLDDLSNINDIILKKDDDGVEWIHLQIYSKLTEPKLFGEDKYDRERKELSYFIQGYIIKKAEKNKLLKFLDESNLRQISLPENNSSSSSLINREKFWSPADKYETKNYDRRVWQSVDGTECKLMVSTTGAKGLLEEDKSEANEKYNIPCKFIFEGLNLKYSPKDGDFTNDSGEMVVTNSGPEGVLIKKDFLLDYLKKKNLDIIWSVTVDKNAKLDKRFMGKYLFGRFSGIYSVTQNREVVGNIKLNEQRKNY